jgi:lipid-binding SYLF domain-containing protein
MKPAFLKTAHRALLLTLVTCLLAPMVQAASKAEIDARVDAALAALYQTTPAARELAGKSAGLLVFPKVLKGGFGIGGAVGEGALLVGGQAVQYYRVTAASIGFQFGGQARSEVLMFMTADALRKFRESDGWEAGVDGSVALAQFGAGEELGTQTLQDPIIGFIYGNKGLMYNLSLEGAKYWKISK